jgi:ATP-dependent protease ClpP protease subunit
MLIHQQQLEWAGKLDDFMDEVENQKELTETLTKIYLDETDISEEQLKDIMSHELWLNSKKCLELGLIDSILS